MRRPLDPLRFSLLLLALVVLIAAGILVANANWPKLLRVTVAATVYVGMLTLRARSSASAEQPWWPFAVAGGLAGLASAALQPVFSIPILLASAAGGALLLGTVHWLGVRYGAALRDRFAT